MWRPYPTAGGSGRPRAREPCAGGLFRADALERLTRHFYTLRAPPPDSGMTASLPVATLRSIHQRPPPGSACTLARCRSPDISLQAYRQRTEHRIRIIRGPPHPVEELSRRTKRWETAMRREELL